MEEGYLAILLMVVVCWSCGTIEIVIGGKPPREEIN